MKNLLEKTPNILVIGDLIIDKYLWGSSQRISPEAPVPIVTVSSESTILGGAGNVINNLKSLGAEVDVMSVLGDCAISLELKLLLEKIQINTKFLSFESKRICSKKTRIIAANQQVIRYDQESTEEISITSQKAIIANIRKRISMYDCILLSDYGKGVLTNNLTKTIITIAKENSIKVIIDPKGLNYEKYTGAYLLTPNRKEASEATQIEINNHSLEKTIKEIKSKYSLEVSLITLSENGIAIYDNSMRIYPTQAREVFDVTGAGDTVLAALGFATGCNLRIDKAVEFANLAAGVVVGKLGSATATLNEIIEYNILTNNSSSENSLKSLAEITNLSKEFKNQSKKLVFTNGCFDILHAGHVDYLKSAKKFGDILIVGLNSDKSIKKIKGDNRPINSQTDRARILGALESVDYVVIFDEKTPLNLINAIKPQILVKGGDYQNKSVVGEDIADELKIVNFVADKSTSNIIEYIKNLK
jgi:D-beta-D-heptose 7-phosphate kinase / D-beta-D-heptose 1-phosphate adenosyltransferase